MKILLMVAIGGAIGAVARQQSNQFIMRIFWGGVSYWYDLREYLWFFHNGIALRTFYIKNYDQL